MHTARHVVNGIGMVLFHEDDAGTPGWLGRVALKDVWRDDREDDPKAHRFKVQMGFETGHQAVIYPGKCGVVLDLIRDVPNTNTIPSRVRYRTWEQLEIDALIP